MKTVLVVEDDAPVRAVFRRILEGDGYRTLEARDAREALVLSETHSVDVAVIDAGLPGMSGPQLAARLSADRPGLLVLLTSGYPEEVIRLRGWWADQYRFLPKPFKSHALLASVRGLY